MSKYTKFSKSTVAILTALLIISIAAPLLSVATAAGAPTASLTVNSGPNGTLVQIHGTGFKANDAYTGNALTGLALTYDGVAAGPATETFIAPAYVLSTDSNGVLTGYFVIYGLNAGPHTIMISDPTSSVVAGIFAITTPTVTLTPSSGAAGTSVLVSAAGFPTSNVTVEPTFTNSIFDAQFSGVSMTIASGVTGTSTDLSSDIIAQDSSLNYVGTYTGTVSLGALTAAGATFTLTDDWNNKATTSLSTTAPTVTLSPSSGPVGTWVTATVSGFGPSTAISTVKVGNGLTTASATASVTPAAPATTEQGTSVFLFQIPAGAVADKAGAAGAQKIAVADALGNVGTATFTVTPKATITLGAPVLGVYTDSGTTSVPQSTVAGAKYILSGFKANTELTISGSPGIPTEWITPASTWTPNTQVSTNNKLKTDANGQVAAVLSVLDTAADYPTSIGQYTITISDGTNSVTTTINVVTPGDILAIPVTSGAAGQTGISFTYFGTHAPSAANLNGAAQATSGPLLAPSAWPTATTNTFTVTAGTPAGLRTFSLTAVGGAYNTIGFTIVSPSVTVISPTSASVGTTVTVVGTGYATSTAVLAIQGATISPSPANLAPGTSLMIATFAVPNYLPGTYTLTVTDSATNTATTSLTVASPTIQISPTTSTLGSATLAITGSGFKANDILTVKFDNGVIFATTPVGLMTSNTNGGIIICSGFDVPTAATAGTHSVSVAGSTGAYATATFTVTPSLASLPAVRPGAKVVITGSGFAMNSLQSLTVNGTATTWLDLSGATAASINQAVVVTSASGTLYTGVAVGFTVAATQAPGTLVIEVKDASGNTASTTMSVLGSPAIAVGTANIVAGTAAASGVSISGTGFAPGAGRAISAKLYSGSTLVTTVPLSLGTVTVDTNGVFAVAAGETFTIPSTVAAGTYTLRITVGITETADTTVTVLGAPTVIAPASAASGSNVTITITGLTAMSTATFNGVAIAQFGPTTVLNTGANAYTETTWFIVPTNLFAGTYLLTVTDLTTTPTTAVQAAITVTPSISVTPPTISKGSTLTVSGTGFATGSALTAKVNGQAVTLSAANANAAGAIPAATTITVPVTALGTNTLTVTDALGNTASATFDLTTPAIQMTPSSTGAGNTVQIIGSGYTAFSPIVIQVGSQVVTTVPAALAANAGGSFITYITVPTGLSGNVTVTATDNSNNVGTATLTVGGSTGTGVPSQTTMTSTAQTTTTSGIATTTFTAGSTVKAGFMLQSTTGSRDVVVAVTFQQGAKVYNMASFATTMDTTARPVSFTNLVPTGATGTWTATLQVFASDGTTPLGVTTLTFTVS